MICKRKNTPMPYLSINSLWPFDPISCSNLSRTKEYRQLQALTMAIRRYVPLFCVVAPRAMNYPDSKVHGANMGSTWVLSAPDGPHVGPMNLAIRVVAKRLVTRINRDRAVDSEPTHDTYFSGRNTRVYFWWLEYWLRLTTFNISTNK